MLAGGMNILKRMIAMGILTVLFMTIINACGNTDGSFWSRHLATAGSGHYAIYRIERIQRK